MATIVLHIMRRIVLSIGKVSDMKLSPGGYVLTTSKKLTPEEAADGIFPPEASVVHMYTEPFGDLVQYTYFIDYLEDVDG